jgi:hypothetical protein
VDAFFHHKDAYLVLVFAVVAIGVVIPFIAHYWYKTRRAEMELSLKQAMVERGMSAEEICAVIEAGQGGKNEGDEEERVKTGYKVRA